MFERIESEVKCLLFHFFWNREHLAVMFYEDKQIKMDFDF
jgi:hypothetical protein